MKLTDDLPLWVAMPLRLLLYAFVMFILYNIALGFVLGQIRSNTQECVVMAQSRQGRVVFAKSMVGCLRQKNNLVANLLMRPIYSAVDAMPNAPKEFVGAWIAEQPRCRYKHTLSEDGTFISEPQGCTLSDSRFQGAWGVYKDKMIWLPDENDELPVWPPDINQIDVVDQDFFLLKELDGTRTRFTRVKATADSRAQSSVDMQSEATPLPETVNTPDSSDYAAISEGPDVGGGPSPSEEPQIPVEADMPHAAEPPGEGEVSEKPKIYVKSDEHEAMGASSDYRN